MIWQDTLHPGLFALIIVSCLTHGAMDAIKDLRTHFGDAGIGGYYGHPYRSFWHILQWFRTAALIGIGLIWSPCITWDGWATAIAAVCGVIIGRFVWDAVYAQPWVWFRLDETIKVRTGWAWLDRILGLHW